VATLELCHRYVRNLHTYTDPDSEGLIRREVVYHEPNSLLAALATRGA
jgi:hypothetical protein